MTGPKVKFIHYGSGILPGVFNHLAREHNLKQAQYRLKTIHMDMESYKQAIKAMLSGRPPHMLMTWAGYRARHLIDQGFIAPIDDLWKGEQLDGVFPLAISRNISYGGSKYAIPLSHHIVVMLYNKKVFTKTG